MTKNATSHFFDIAERASDARDAGNTQLAQVLEAQQEEARIAALNALAHERKAMNFDVREALKNAFKP